MDKTTQNRSTSQQASNQRVTASNANCGHEQSRDLLAKAVATAVLIGGLNAIVQLVRLAVGH